MSKLKWTAPTTNTDGSPFDASQFAGFEFEFDGQSDVGAVSIPLGWDNDGQYEFDVETTSLAPGQHNVQMRTVHKNGLKSAWTNAVVFVIADTRVPNPPKNLAVEV